MLEEKQRLKRSLKACFLHGSNTMCCGHIASLHFEVYKSRCNAAIPPIPIHYCCLPQEVLDRKKGQKQSTLNFPKVKRPEEFTWGAVLDAVAKLIACDDQVRLGVRLIST
jgi:hypothetical protein